MLPLVTAQTQQELLRSKNYICSKSVYIWASQVAVGVKNLCADTGDRRDEGSVPGSGRPPGGGHRNPLQYFCLEKPMDRETWWARVHWVAKSRT